MPAIAAMLCVAALTGFVCARIDRYSLLMEKFPADDTKVFDRQGALLAEIPIEAMGYQTSVPIEMIPAPLKDMTLALEDRHFYRHFGIWPPSVARAVFKNILHLQFAEGGSTITQQLARIILDSEKPRKRGIVEKMDEALLALYLEWKHDKEWILEKYLNSAFYGNMSYGVEAASVRYFSRHVWELSVGEQAMLAALPKAPSRLNPLNGGIGHTLESRRKRALALIGRDAGQPVVLHPSAGGNNVAPHFVREVLNALKPSTGEKIITTLDAGLQIKISAILDRKLEDISPENPRINGAVVVLDVKTGECLAMAGSRNFWSPYGGSVNMAVAPRHPGSALKPFTYFAAFANGMTPESLIADEPRNYLTAEGIPYTPKNFDRRYHGIVTAREALANSLNVPAVAVLDSVGVGNFIELLKNFGIETLDMPADHYGLALTLGGGAVRLIDLTNAYAALARGGRYLPWRIIPGGEVQPRPVIANGSARLSHLVTSILSDSYARRKAFGSTSALEISNQTVAVKTGTSHSYRDKWMIGYSPRYAVGVWVGRADGEALPGMTGVSAAAPIWHDVMEMLHKDLPAVEFEKPDDIGSESALSRGLPPVMISGDDNLLNILSPRPNEVFSIDPAHPREHQRIPFEAKLDKPARIEWYLDGTLISRGSARFFKNVEAGRHVALAKIGGRGLKEIPFTVVDGE